MKSILIAEDEAAIREFITLNLTHSGYSVVEAENGKEAVELFEKKKESRGTNVPGLQMPGGSRPSICPRPTPDSDILPDGRL